MTRIKLLAALPIVLAAIAGAVPAAADDVLGEPQWPKVALDEPQWPNIPADKLPEPLLNPNLSFLDPDQVANRILGISGEGAVTGSAARWPELPPDPRPPVPSFAFEVGARYWYSWGGISFAFANGDPQFGSPTSTLDWHGLNAHSGEVFGRIDHQPTGLFVKGMLGLGSIGTGQIEDRDFLAQQIRFSDTTSDVKDGRLGYAMIDIGWAYSPVPDIRVGVFAGYHYWRENVTAFGVRCNDTRTPINLCGPGGSVAISFDTEVLRYEPTVHAARLGVEGRFAITDRWSASIEVAAVPYVALQNADSHLLRQTPSDLGRAPNVITKTTYAFGVEAELFFNYALPPNIELGAGARYWGVGSNYGGVRFGPTFDTGLPLNSFDVQRYGLLAHVKGRF